MPRTTKARTVPIPSRRAVALALLVVLLGACGEDSDDNADHAADIYIAVIRSVAPNEGTTMPKAVYVELAPEVKLSIEDQAHVVKAFQDPVTVRFIDDRVEAIDNALPQAKVRRDGVLIRLNPATDTDDGVSVKATRYTARDDERTYCLELTDRSNAWAVASSASC